VSGLPRPENHHNPPPICRHWARRGTCLYGDSCGFLHEREGSNGGGGAVGGRAGQEDGTSGRVRHHARNRSKAGDFRRWLVDTFGIDTLRQAGGVAGLGMEQGRMSLNLKP